MEVANKKTKNKLRRLWKDIKYNRFLYLLLLPSLVCVIIFSYLPMLKITLAFQEYNMYNPEMSEWVGFDNFRTIFANDGMVTSIFNTLYVSILNLIVGFPLTIIFALLLNEMRNKVYKKIVQTVSYLPHFLSWISIIGIYSTLMAMHGPVNDLLSGLFGTERMLFLTNQSFFVPSIVFLSVWQGLGWSSIVYLAAISGVDETLYEAVKIDGGGRFRQIWHVTLPSIRPTIAIMLVLQLGGLMGSNFELVFGLQNPYIDFETISTITYKNGIEGGEYGVATALGLFTGVVSFTLVRISNFVSKKLTDVGLF